MRPISTTNIKAKIIFVSGTDTDVGKTIICSFLAHTAEQVVYWKPVQAGTRIQDAHTIKRLAPHVIIEPSRYIYESEASPDQAALRETDKPAVQLNILKREFEVLANKHQDKELIIIEGAGGLLVPLNERCETWIEFLIQTQLSVVLVARSGLGTLNHTALSLKQLFFNDLGVDSVILNGPYHEPNVHSLRRWFPELCFISIPKWETLEMGVLKKEAQNKHAILWNALTGQHKIKEQQDDNSLEKKDQRYVWHPYTQHKIIESPLVIKKAQGSWLYSDQGEKLFDCSASWWVNTIGHGRQPIREAMAQQQARLDHCIFAAATHEPAVKLAEQLVSLTQGHLQRVFYSDNGSTAVEIALKIAFQSWVNQGETQRTKFLSFYGSYHGDTFGTMAVAAATQFHRPFEPLLFKTDYVRPLTIHPSVFCPRGIAEKAERMAELKQCLAQHHHEYAGVIIEPLIQGAGGMAMQDVEWLQYLGELCQQYGIPLILDEVFTGLGRCGEYFAFLRAQLKPDIVAIAKGLTGGTIPLAVTMASEKLFRDFCHDDKSKALMHGHSFTGNPISCAAALASLKIYEDEKLIARSREIERLMTEWTQDMKSYPKCHNLRALGAVLAFEVGSSHQADYFDTMWSNIVSEGRDLGLFLRPLGNTIYCVPPLTTPLEELAWVLKQLTSLVEKL